MAWWRRRIACQAFKTVFKRKSAKHGRLLDWLGEKERSNWPKSRVEGLALQRVVLVKEG